MEDINSYKHVSASRKYMFMIFYETIQNPLLFNPPPPIKTKTQQKQGWGRLQGYV